MHRVVQLRQQWKLLCLSLYMNARSKGAQSTISRKILVRAYGFLYIYFAYMCMLERYG